MTARAGLSKLGSNNEAQPRFRSSRPVFQMNLLQVSLLWSTRVLKSAVENQWVTRWHPFRGQHGASHIWQWWKKRESDPFFPQIWLQNQRYALRCLTIFTVPGTSPFPPTLMFHVPRSSLWWWELLSQVPTLTCLSCIAPDPNAYPCKWWAHWTGSQSFTGLHHTVSHGIRPGWNTLDGDLLTSSVWLQKQAPVCYRVHWFQLIKWS